MGAVHGVSLKYVVISACAGFIARTMLATEDLAGSQMLLACFWCYTCVLNGIIALLFNLGMGMSLMGKSPADGSVPLWSYLVYIGFHAPTWLYTRIHHWKDQRAKVPPATEVEPGWWVGGRYGAELGKTWAGVIDMTCEFPEGCAADTYEYLLVPCWDGVPPTPEALERAALFGLSAREGGDVMVHCAHGRGRSTTVMCACLVKAGMHKNWESALEAIKKRRKVAKLNSAMRAALSSWQSQYMQTTPTRAGQEVADASVPFWAVGPLRWLRSRIREHGRSKVK